MGVITISREFGSGGRELGKRLADALGYAYYDREIVEQIAKKSQLDENYVSYALEGGMFRNFPVHFGRTFSYSPMLMANETTLLSEQNKLLKELADAGNCVIVGRAADVILRDYKPFNLFVYSDMPSKVARCRAKGYEHEHISDKEMMRKIRKIDNDRRKYHSMISDIPWGNRHGYHLCINTSGRDINVLVPFVTEYYKQWRSEQK